MKKYAFTFGSGQLKEIQYMVNPMSVILVIEAPDKGTARDIVFGSFIGKNFCTSYPESSIKEFEEKYGMRQYSLQTLQMMRNPEFRDNDIKMTIIKRKDNDGL